MIKWINQPKDNGNGMKTGIQKETWHLRELGNRTGIEQ